MPLPPGLTNITIHIADEEERRMANAAMARKDWRTYSRYRDAIILHFGKDRVRIPAGKMAIDELQRAASRAREAEAQEMMYKMAMAMPEEIRIPAEGVELPPKPKPKPKRIGGNLWERISDDDDWI